MECTERYQSPSAWRRLGRSRLEYAGLISTKETGYIRNIALDSSPRRSPIVEGFLGRHPEKRFPHMLLNLMKVSGHGGQGFFHFHNLPNLREEPRIDLGDLMDFLQ